MKNVLIRLFFLCIVISSTQVGCTSVIQKPIEIVNKPVETQPSAMVCIVLDDRAYPPHAIDSNISIVLTNHVPVGYHKIQAIYSDGITKTYSKSIIFLVLKPESKTEIIIVIFNSEVHIFVKVETDFNDIEDMQKPPENPYQEKQRFDA